MKTRGIQRKTLGLSIIEMMVALAVTGVAIAGLTEITWLSFDWINKFTTKVDVNISAKRALERVGADLRVATAIGDSFDTQADTTPSFPSTNNPLYSSGLPAGAANSYLIDDNTLIVQLPVFNRKGWPTSIPWSIDSRQRRNLDTIIYEVLQDPDASEAALGKYILKRTVFAGIHDDGLIPNVNSGTTICPGQTILTGIIGPLDKTSGKPRVFQALDELDPAGNPVPLSQLRTGSLSKINAIVMSVEISRSQGSAKNTSTASYRSEIFMRNRHYVE